ncbi:MAG: rod-binding protein [Alphaproteobacteria bacterium]|nr:rod-binding protein [Alphaproteobacteria bacterium]MCL2505515.1 rod-binding protein [Alphaproteobacteria bacterium]
MIGAVSSALTKQYSHVSAEQMIKIERTAKDFEAMFATEMMRPIFDTVPVNSLFGGGNAENIARSFLLQEYGKSIASTGSLGIAPMVKEAMLRLQEANNNRAIGENNDRTA